MTTQALGPDHAQPAAEPTSRRQRPAPALPDPARLEDKLAEGVASRLVALPQLEGAAGRDGELHTQRTGEVLDTAYARAALEQGELLSPLPADKLDAQLTELYRKTKSDLAEGGANTLLLAVGFLC